MLLPTLRGEDTSEEHNFLSFSKRNQRRQLIQLKIVALTPLVTFRMSLNKRQQLLGQYWITQVVLLKELLLQSLTL